MNAVRLNTSPVYALPAPVVSVGYHDPNRAAAVRSEAAELQYQLTHRATEYKEIPATRRSLIDMLADLRTVARHGAEPIGRYTPETEAREVTRRQWLNIYRDMSDLDLLTAAAAA